MGTSYEGAYTCSSQAENLAKWMCRYDMLEEGEDRKGNTLCNCGFWGTLIVVGVYFAGAGGMLDE